MKKATLFHALNVCVLLERIWVKASAELAHATGISVEGGVGEISASQPPCSSADKGLFPNVRAEAGAGWEEALNCCSLSAVCSCTVCIRRKARQHQ
uniref:Secreted protein n=1 Tax=Hippocampus comes TaxID=109280 RepID=A0A3Q2XMR0_HIPCM